MPRHVRFAFMLVLGCGTDGGAGLDSTGGEPGTTSSTGPNEEDTAQVAATGTDTGTDTGTSTAPGSEGTSTGQGLDESGTWTDPPACGDLICAPDEDATSCCADCGVCDDGATVRMETGVLGGVPGAGLTPGGIADTHAQFAGGSFAELVYPMTIQTEPVDGSSWFWAQQFFFEGTTEGGYIGVQANGILGGEVVGKMMIGSIWNATEATPGPGASCEPFGGEGIGYSCRLAFPWRQNVTYRMVVRESRQDWWSIVMVDPATHTDVLLGDIHVPPEYGRIRPPTAGFAEYYGGVDACEALPHAVALLHAPIADGAAPTAVDAGTYGPCAAQASSVCTGPLCT